MDPADPAAASAPALVRSLAGRLRARADEVRDEAGRLARLADGTPWTGLAADVARARCHERATDLRAHAAAHDAAADALERHAASVGAVAAVARAGAVADLPRRVVDALRDAG